MYTNPTTDFQVYGVGIGDEMGLEGCDVTVEVGHENLQIDCVHVPSMCTVPDGGSGDAGAHGADAGAPAGDAGPANPADAGATGPTGPSGADAGGSSSGHEDGGAPNDGGSATGSDAGAHGGADAGATGPTGPTGPTGEDGGGNHNSADASAGGADSGHLTNTDAGHSDAGDGSAGRDAANNTPDANGQPHPATDGGTGDNHHLNGTDAGTSATHTTQNPDDLGGCGCAIGAPEHQNHAPLSNADGTVMLGAAIAGTARPIRRRVAQLWKSLVS